MSEREEESCYQGDLEVMFRQILVVKTCKSVTFLKWMNRITYFAAGKFRQERSRER